MLAPIYALAIAFVLVLILGAALNHPAPPGPPPPVQFKLDIQGMTELAKEFQDFPGLALRVGVVGAKEQLADVQLGRSGQFMLLVPDGDIRICMRIPKGWSAEGMDKDRASGDSCRQISARTENAQIMLRKGP